MREGYGSCTTLPTVSGGEAGGGNSADTVSCLEYVEGWKNLESIQSFESRKIIGRSRDLFLLILGQTRFESTELACFRFELHIQ
jgi:hypothetical protein